MTYALHIVQPGDTLTRVARLYGISDWRSIYYAPENAEFRRKRPNPDRIHPGDKIVVVHQRPGPSFELPPGPPTIGSTPPPAPPTQAPPSTQQNTDFIFALPPLDQGKVGFDASNGVAVHPHEERQGVTPWLLLPLRQPRVIQLVRRNIAVPDLNKVDVRFTSTAFATQTVAPGPVVALGLTATAEGKGVMRAVHVPTGRPVAAIELEAVRSVDHQGILLLRVKLHDVTTARSEADVLTAFQRANALFLGQTNVQWLAPRQADVATFARKGGALDAADLDALWQEVRGKVPAGPRHAVVFFVRNLTDVRADGATPVAGVTVGTTDQSLRGLIAISDLSPAPERTLAHELGHLCGLDVGQQSHPSSRGFSRNVMFRSDGQQRDSLYRDQIGLIRKLPP
jgi:hypothetical protein